MASTIEEYSPKDISESPHKEKGQEEEEEEDLFEIDFKVCNSIPPPHYYWESYLTSTNSALMANCLLPISDLSNAVPMITKSQDANYPLLEKPSIFIFAESMAEDFLGLPSSLAAISMLLN